MAISGGRGLHGTGLATAPPDLLHSFTCWNMRSGRAWSLLKCAVDHWATDRAATTGAALAFYCAFSLAPLLIIVVTLTGWIVGAQTAEHQLAEQLRALFGPATAGVVMAAMDSAQSSNGAIAASLSVVTLIIGATTVFAALEGALQDIWGARAIAPRGMYGWLRARLLSFGLILAVGFLLLVSLTVSTAIAALRTLVAKFYEELVIVTALLDFVITLGLIAGLIAVIYRYLPARRLSWPPDPLGSTVDGAAVPARPMGDRHLPGPLDAALRVRRSRLIRGAAALALLLRADLPVRGGVHRLPRRDPCRREDGARATPGGCLRCVAAKASSGALRSSPWC